MSVLWYAELFFPPSSSSWFPHSCCRVCRVKWEGIHSINYSQQMLLMLFVICVISRSSGTQEKPAMMGWVQLDSVCSHYVGSINRSRVSVDAAQKDYGQTLQTTAAHSVSEFDQPWRQRESDNIFPSVGARSCWHTRMICWVGSTGVLNGWLAPVEELMLAWSPCQGAWKVWVWEGLLKVCVCVCACT